ncbi:MAG: ABC transporter substrate-binding protein [Lachnospiraceae bacterium]|nr:ABC transporter substrate-binding protein [Lachnospiraceae bacterium]
MMKRNVLLCALIIIMTLLCGCGKEGTNGEQANSITVGISQDMDSLDPHIAVAAGTKEVLFNVFEGLVKPDTEGNLNPAVAEEYKISEDGMKYTFILREGISFHNGERVTAADVEYSIRRCAGMLETKEEGVIVEPALSVISQINVVDEKTIELVLSKKDTELLGYLTCAIIPKDYKEMKSNPVGTGPFKFESYKPLESIVLAKNEEYWGDKAYLDKVTFKISADTDALFLELMGGNVDIIPYLTDAQAQSLPDDYELKVGTMNLVQGVYFNCDREPFNNEKVRQAMCYAIDRQNIIDMVAGGRGEITGSNVSPRFAKYFSTQARDLYSKDVNKAKELLKEAGISNLSFTLTVPSNYTFHVDTAQVVAGQLKEAGITVNIEQVDWATWLSRVYGDRDYQATIIGLASDLAPSDTVARFYSSASNNFVNYNSNEFDMLFEEAKASSDDDKKVELYNKIQMLMAKDAPAAYIQDPALLMAVSSKLEGVRFYPVQVLDMSGIKYKD